MLGISSLSVYLLVPLGREQNETTKDEQIPFLLGHPYERLFKEIKIVLQSHQKVIVASKRKAAA